MIISKANVGGYMAFQTCAERSRSIPNLSNI